MQSLGLGTESKRSDGWLKSLFWPAVDNAWDVNYLGQQGFWICIAIAVTTLAVSLLTGNVMVISAAALGSLFYFLGGMGVREATWPAAALVLAVYLLGILTQMAAMQLPGVISCIFAAVLLSNLRATFLASEWRPMAEGEDRPTRFNETIADKIVDQMPAKLWPVMQAPFYVLSVVMLLLTLAGMGLILAGRFGLLPHGMTGSHG